MSKEKKIILITLSVVFLVGVVIFILYINRDGVKLGKFDVMIIESDATEIAQPIADKYSVALSDISLADSDELLNPFSHEYDVNITLSGTSDLQPADRIKFYIEIEDAVKDGLQESMGFDDYCNIIASVDLYGDRGLVITLDYKEDSASLLEFFDSEHCDSYKFFRNGDSFMLTDADVYDDAESGDGSTSE